MHCAFYRCGSRHTTVAYTQQNKDADVDTEKACNPCFTAFSEKSESYRYYDSRPEISTASSTREPAWSVIG
jgi:hypothetical protein